MTGPTLTYGHGFLHDGDSVTGWTENEDGTTGTTTSVAGDYLKLNVTVSAGNKIYQWINDTDIGISTSLFTKIMWRYRCSNSSIKAAIRCVFSDAGTQDVLEESNSTNFTVGSATLTAAKTLDHITLNANQATGYVLYDFVLVYMNSFGIVDWDRLDFMPPGRYSDIDIPSRSTDVTQGLGDKNAVVEVDGVMRYGQTWGTGASGAAATYGAAFYQIAAARYGEPWQWFTSDLCSMKVTLREPRISLDKNGEGYRQYSLRLQEYRLSDAASSDVGEAWYERWGMV